MPSSCTANHMKDFSSVDVARGYKEIRSLITTSKWDNM